MGVLHLQPAAEGAGHDGEVYCCRYLAEGAFVLSGGWDGFLRLWDTAACTPITAVQAALKPLSSCAISPDGGLWLSGTMEGVLTVWDAVTHQSRLTFLAHTRPVSDVCFTPDARYLATASWDRHVVLRKAGKEREGRTLAGHHDIVSGCRFLPDGGLLSWSHDGTLRLWDPESAREVAQLTGHADRITAAGLSPDGRWAASGTRDGEVKLWDLTARAEVGSVRESAEIRGCFFLGEGQFLLTVDAEGWAVLLSVPELEAQEELATGLRVLCGDLAPAATQLALGTEDGRLRFLSVEGLGPPPLAVTPTRQARRHGSVFDRLLGKAQVTHTYHYTCPACRRPAEVETLPPGPFACPHCRRGLRIGQHAPQLQNG